MGYKTICIRDVTNPIAISPCYNNRTVERFVDPGLNGNRISDYKNVSIENVTETPAGNVLLADCDDPHRTEAKLDGAYERTGDPAGRASRGGIPRRPLALCDLLAACDAVVTNYDRHWPRGADRKIRMSPTQSPERERRCRF